jgi:serine/threonine protein phosphatase PrpC
MDKCVAFAELDCELGTLASTHQIADNEGSTATVALITDNELHLAYVGDSAALLVDCETQNSTRLCQEVDTAASNENEVARVERAGGMVLKVGGTLRVQGELAVTRALGDLKYKPYVTSEPHIVHVSLPNAGLGQRLVLATDGLWNFLTPEDVATTVAASQHLPESEIAELLYSAALLKGSNDNITIAVINLHKRAHIHALSPSTSTPSPLAPVSVPVSNHHPYPPPAPTSRCGNKSFVFP